jgi:hypothetical protein
MAAKVRRKDETRPGDLRGAVVGGIAQDGARSARSWRASAASRIAACPAIPAVAIRPIFQRGVMRRFCFPLCLGLCVLTWVGCTTEAPKKGLVLEIPTSHIGNLPIAGSLVPSAGAAAPTAPITAGSFASASAAAGGGAVIAPAPFVGVPAQAGAGSSYAAGTGSLAGSASSGAAAGSGGSCATGAAGSGAFFGIPIGRAGVAGNAACSGRR